VSNLNSKVCFSLLNRKNNRQLSKGIFGYRNQPKVKIKNVKQRGKEQRQEDPKNDRHSTFFIWL